MIGSEQEQTQPTLKKMNLPFFFDDSGGKFLLSLFGPFFLMPLGYSFCSAFIGILRRVSGDEENINRKGDQVPQYFLEIKLTAGADHTPSKKWSYFFAWANRVTGFHWSSWHFCLEKSRRQFCWDFTGLLSNISGDRNEDKHIKVTICSVSSSGFAHRGADPSHLHGQRK